MNDIKISFNGKPVTCAGTTSMITFENPEFMIALRQMFMCPEKEKITGIRIDKDSIVAYFELDKPE